MPRGHYQRIEGRRSPAQKAHAESVKAQTWKGADFALNGGGRGAPSASWWVGLSHDELNRQAEIEKARMAQSKFAHITRLDTGD